MSNQLQLAVVGVGRIGAFHARHASELSAREGSCRLAALVDPRPDLPSLAAELSSIQGSEIQTFATLEAFFDDEPVDASVVASPTALHRSHAQALIDQGQRVLVEKPLTPSLVEDRAFAVELDTHKPNALMLAFQRRFDAPLLHTQALLDSGCIGRPFKFVSILEDSLLMPEGYESPGLLQDMSVHNVDEVLWLSGLSPTQVKAQGSRLYTHRIAPVEEDFDDALLQLEFQEEAVAQIHVSRNHVAGYRVETWVFGEEGVIHSGCFHQDPHEVVVEAYGRNGPIETRYFRLRDYGKPVPEFMDRFGDAYAAELHAFVEHCREGTPFPVDHGDAVRAMEVIDQGVRSLRSETS